MLKKNRLVTGQRRRVEYNLSSEDGGLYRMEGFNNDEWWQVISEIEQCIIDGISVPEKYYRRSRGLDYLLNDHGLIHLHLDPHGNDDILLFVRQTEEMVRFEMITNHSIFDEKPRGKSVIDALKPLPPSKPKTVVSPTTRPTADEIKARLFKTPPKKPTNESAIRYYINIVKALF